MDNTKRYTKAIRDQLAGPLEDMGILVHRHIEKMHFNGRYQKMTIVLKSNVDVCHVWWHSISVGCPLQTTYL